MNVYTNNLKNRFLAALALPQIFRFALAPCLIALLRVRNKKFEVPPCQIPNFSIHLGITFAGFVFCFICFAVQGLFCQDRRSSVPYLSGDTFRSFADFIIDETNQPFFPEKVVSGSTIFVKTDYLSHFFNHLHPLILSPYILITHNSDLPIPNDFAHMLDDEKLIGWFGQNVENYTHPKLHPIPIGIANRYWSHGNPDLFDKVKNGMHDAVKGVLLYMNFSIDIYVNFSKSTYFERSRVFDLFVAQPFCSKSFRKDMYSYLFDLQLAKCVLSPRGHGLDTHRTWEALYMGAFPVVRTSTLDCMYEGLPVIIVNDWKDVTQSFLEQKYEEMKNQEFAWEKIYADYWFKLIGSYKIHSQ